MIELYERLLTLPIKKDSGHLVVMAGGAGSGKSFSIKNFTNITDFAKIVDIDQLKKMILSSDKLKLDFFNWLHKNLADNPKVKDLESPDMITPLLLSDTSYGVFIHEYILNTNMFNRRLRATKITKPNIVIDGTLRYIPAVERQIEKLYNHGYTPDKSHLIYVYTTLDTSKRRNTTRYRREHDSFIEDSYYSVLENVLDFIRNKSLPAGMSGSFSILVNNTDTNNNNLKYYTVMKDGVWDENKIRQFFSEQKIVDKSEDDIESNKATINESYINNPSVVFQYFGKSLGITQNKKGSFVLYNRDTDGILPTSMVLGLNYIFDSSSSLKDIKDKLQEITFVRNIKGVV